MYWHKYTLFPIQFAVVWAVFAYRNPFHGAKITVVGALPAVGVGWVPVVVSTVAKTRIVLSLASTAAELETLTDGDGARHVFAVLVGWIFLTLSVSAICVDLQVPRFGHARVAL